MWRQDQWFPRQRAENGFTEKLDTHSSVTPNYFSADRIRSG